MPVTKEKTPASLICPSCKEETGITREFVMTNLMSEDCYCPHCKKLVFSCRPEVSKYSYTYTGATGVGGTDWDAYED